MIKRLKIETRLYSFPRQNCRHLCNVSNAMLFIIKAAFDSSFAPAFRAFKLFIHTLILQRISNFSNAAGLNTKMHLVVDSHGIQVRFLSQMLKRVVNKA